LVRACTSHSSSSSSSYRDYKVNTPSIEEPMWKLEQDRGEAFRRQQELLKRLRERPLVMPDNPEGDLAPGVPKDAGRDIREDVDKMQQQPAPPAAPDKPDRGPGCSPDPDTEVGPCRFSAPTCRSPADCTTPCSMRRRTSARRSSSSPRTRVSGRRHRSATRRCASFGVPCARRGCGCRWSTIPI